MTDKEHQAVVAQAAREAFEQFTREMKFQTGQQYERSDLYQAFLAGATHGITCAMKINREVNEKNAQ